MDSFPGTLRDLRSVPQNNALTVALTTLDEQGDAPAAPLASSTKLLHDVVSGDVEPILVAVR